MKTGHHLQEIDEIPPSTPPPYKYRYSLNLVSIMIYQINFLIDLLLFTDYFKIHPFYRI